MIAKFRGRSLKNLTLIFIRPQRPQKAQLRIQKKMSWANLVFPIDTKNSIGFFVQFFFGQPGLVGDSVHISNLSSIKLLKIQLWLDKRNLFVAYYLCNAKKPRKYILPVLIFLFPFSYLTSNVKEMFCVNQVGTNSICSLILH